MKIRQVRLAPVVALVMSLAIAGGVTAQDGGASAAFAELSDLDGAAVGRVTWTAVEAGVLVEVQVEGLTPGFHGFHVHEIGLCEPPFTSAGGHLNLADVDHPGHSGDGPLLLVNADGTGEASFVTDRYTVNDLFGTGVIVHELADNYADIPDRYVSPEASPAADAEAMLVAGPDAATLATGDGGARIACGPIAIPKPASS